MGRKKRQRGGNLSPTILLALRGLRAAKRARKLTGGKRRKRKRQRGGGVFYPFLHPDKRGW